MSELKKRLEAIWNDGKVRNPLRRVRWMIADNTGALAVRRKKKRGIEKITARLNKKFSWRK